METPTKCMRLNSSASKFPRRNAKTQGILWKNCCVFQALYIQYLNDFFSLPSFASAVKTRCTVCKAPAFQIVQSLKFAFVYVSKVLYFFYRNKADTFSLLSSDQVDSSGPPASSFFFFFLFCVDCIYYSSLYQSVF